MAFFPGASHSGLTEEAHSPKLISGIFKIYLNRSELEMLLVAEEQLNVSLP
jgi:hypothetical protein